MVGAKRLFPDRQRALVVRPRRSEIPFRLKQESEIVEVVRGIGVVGAERLLANRQCALTKRPRRGEITPILSSLARLWRVAAVSG